MKKKKQKIKYETICTEELKDSLNWFVCGLKEIIKEIEVYESQTKEKTIFLDK